MNSNIYFVSDNHYFHKNILTYCRDTRLGETVEEMNSLMVDAHNSVVRQEDTVYFLGDFSFGTVEQTKTVLDYLNGKKHLIYGNHDQVIRNSSMLQSSFESVQDYKRIKIGKRFVMLFHFPIREWDMRHHGHYHLYGHMHGRLEDQPNGRSMDVGIDTRFNMTPWSWDEIDAILKEREI